LQLTESNSTDAEINNANIDIQSALLASVLVGGIEINHSGVNSELANLYKTFTELNQQQSQLLSQVLSAHSMEYIEHIEHEFTDLQDQLKSIIVKLIIVLALLTLAFSFTMFIFRVFELKRNNLSYQEAAD
ncbi:hybrid sensor histidine kinase/response regulator, partial [Vibrio sp. 10N.222.55.C6]